MLFDYVSFCLCKNETKLVKIYLLSAHSSSVFGLD